jgi:branched-chain amino acid transport system substrate-binding protein
VVVEALRKLQADLPAGQNLAALPTKELRQRLNAAILAGSYDTPLGPIRFTPQGEVIQNDFHVAQVRMNPDGRSGRFQLLP